MRSHRRNKNNVVSGTLTTAAGWRLASPVSLVNLCRRWRCVHRLRQNASVIPARTCAHGVMLAQTERRRTITTYIDLTYTSSGGSPLDE